MAKKSWLDHLKKYFGFQSKMKEEKKEKTKGWMFRRLKSKCSPALTASLPLKAKTLQEAEEEQSKHALAAAVATAAAAEAAVAAAQAAAQAVRLTGTPLSYQRSHEAAAIKIQTAFRGYLARRALRALRGLVRLQALVRGQAVRHQTNITLRSLQSLMKIQSRACATRMRSIEDREACEGKANIHLKNKEENIRIMVKPNGERRWDGSILSKDEINATLKSRIEAALKRERVRGYTTFHQGRRHSRRPTTLVADKVESEVLYHRWRWLEEWVGSQPCEKDISKVSPINGPDRNRHDHQLYVSVSSDKEETEIRPLARRSFNMSRQTSLRDDESYTSSPSVPSYMAFTASTKAKFRSMSTPRQRMGMADTYSEYCIPYMNRPLSPVTSIASDAGLSKTGNFVIPYQKVPLD